MGISADPVDKHKRFSLSNRLNFPLLSDVNGDARKAFHVQKNLFGLVPGRVTYLIDQEGIVRDVFNSQLDFDGHVKRSIQFVKQQQQEVNE